MTVRSTAGGLAAAVGVLQAFAASAQEQPAPAPRAPAVQVVVDCRKIGESAARLACYDRGVDALTQAEVSGDLVTMDRQQRTAIRRQAYGFNLPSLSLLDHDKAGKQDDRLTARVASASRDDSGRWVVRLEDGAVWAQSDNAIVSPEPHPGSTAVIRHGTLGSFFMAIDGKPGFRAVRRS